MRLVTNVEYSATNVDELIKNRNQRHKCDGLFHNCAAFVYRCVEFKGKQVMLTTSLLVYNDFKYRLLFFLFFKMYFIG